MDNDVLKGNKRHPEFEWYQHAPALLPNGDLLVFDNGQDREYTGLEDYSRAVCYSIDEEDLAIRQIWQYGKGRGKEVFSRLAGDVDYFENEDHILVNMGNMRYSGSNYGKSIELDYKPGRSCLRLRSSRLWPCLTW